MAQAPASDPPAPPSVLVYTVQAQNRIRVPREDLEALVSWLKGRSASGVAVLGPRGGLSIVPQSAIEKALGQLAAADEAALGNGESAEADYARFLASRWPVSFSFEDSANRYTVTLPEGARKVGVLPPEGGTVVVFAWGGLLEIWDARQWVDHLKSRGYTIGGVLRALG